MSKEERDLRQFFDQTYFCQKDIRNKIILHFSFTKIGDLRKCKANNIKVECNSQS